MEVADAQLQNLIKITKVRKGRGVACVFSNQLGPFSDNSSPLLVSQAGYGPDVL